MINKEIFKREFLRKDNKSFEKKYRLFDEQVVKSVTSDLENIIDKFSSGECHKEDFKEVLEKMKKL